MKACCHRGAGFPLQHQGYELHPPGYHRHKGSEINLCQWEKCDPCNVLSSALNAIRWLIQQSSQQTARRVLFLDSNCDCTNFSFHPFLQTLLVFLPSTWARTFASRSFLTSYLLAFSPPWDQPSLLPCLQEQKCLLWNGTPSLTPHPPSACPVKLLCRIGAKPRGHIF